MVTDTGNHMHTNTVHYKRFSVFSNRSHDQADQSDQDILTADWLANHVTTTYKSRNLKSKCQGTERLRSSLKVTFLTAKQAPTSMAASTEQTGCNLRWKVLRDLVDRYEF